jgi:hypothetical protein
MNSIIPHVFGRNRPTVIDNLPTLKKVHEHAIFRGQANTTFQELELVDALGDMVRLCQSLHDFS